MDAETAAAITQLADRIEAVREEAARSLRWLSEQHEREWKTSAAWRTQWSAELDALEAQVDMLTAELRRLRTQLEGPNDANTR